MAYILLYIATIALSCSSCTAADGCRNNGGVVARVVAVVSSFHRFVGWRATFGVIPWPVEDAPRSGPLQAQRGGLCKYSKTLVWHKNHILLICHVPCQATRLDRHEVASYYGAAMSFRPENRSQWAKEVSLTGHTCLCCACVDDESLSRYVCLSLSDTASIWLSHTANSRFRLSWNSHQDWEDVLPSCNLRTFAGKVTVRRSLWPRTQVMFTYKIDQLFV